MRGPATAILLALLALFSMPLLPAAPQAQQGTGNHPPSILEVVLNLEKGDNAYYGLVGEPIEGYVRVVDPDGDPVSVVVNFTGPENRSVELQEGETPGVFPICVDTSSWAPGRYKMAVLVVDARGARATYTEPREIWLRKELSPPPESGIWVYTGLGLLSCLLVAMALAFSKALAAGRREMRRGPSWLSPEVY